MKGPNPMSKEKIIPEYQEFEDVKDFEKLLEDLDSNLESVETIMQDSKTGENEPLSKHTLLPVIVDLLKAQLESGQFIISMLEDEKGEDFSEKPNVAYLSVGIIARFLHAVWSKMKTGKKKNIQFLNQVAQNIEAVLSGQTVEIPLLLYDDIRNAIENNTKDKRFMEVAIALLSEQTGTTPEEFIAQLGQEDEQKIIQIQEQPLEELQQENESESEKQETIEESEKLEEGEDE